MRSVNFRRGGLGFAVNFRLFFACLVLFLGFVGGASAATLDVPGTYPTIQAAINAANIGDTINVSAGTYNENVDVNKSVNLIGAGAGVTTVQATNSGDHVIEVTANSVNISGFTVTGATNFGSAGIYLVGVNFSNISNNNASNNYWSGIYLRYSSNNTITNNTASSNNYKGIYLYSSSNNTITNNAASNNNHGIYLYSSSSTTITNNTAKENSYDVHVSASSDAQCNNIIENNTGSGDRPIKYFNSSVSLQDEVLSELILCDADNSNIDNVTIKGSTTKRNNGLFVIRTDNSNFTNINSSNNYYGIILQFSSNNTITNNTASNNWEGLPLSSSSNNNLITSNTVNSNNYIGIYLYSSSSNTLTDNTAKENNDYDVYGGSDSYCNNIIENNTGSGDRPIKYFNSSVSLQDEVLSELILCDADNSNIDNVTIKGSTTKRNNGLFVIRTDNSNFTNINSSNNNYGIRLGDSTRNTLTNNTVNSNSYSGIDLISSSNNTLTDNTANSNNWHGISLTGDSNYNTLTNNTANLNIWYGIRLRDSSNNLIYNNLFNNANNFYFSGTNSNDWNTTKTLGTNIIGNSYLGGNFWANPSGTGFSETCADVDYDGICDSSYTLATGNVDYLPLVETDTSLATIANATWNYIKTFSENGRPYGWHNTDTGQNGTYFNPAEVGFYSLSPILAYEMGLDCDGDGTFEPKDPSSSTDDWDCAMNKTSLILSNIEALPTYQHFVWDIWKLGDNEAPPDYTENASDEFKQSHVIWELGDNEAPPDYTENASDEFDQSKPFNSHYYVETMAVNEFPEEINDGNFTQTYIHFNLTSREADDDLSLFLDTLYASHGLISFYNLRIKVMLSNGSWAELGEYKFASDGSYPEERYIGINGTYLEPGENIILLENANPTWTGYWLVWDSLKLLATHPHYYVGVDPASEFPEEINDGTLTEIYIHFNLTAGEAGETQALFLDTLYATHDNSDNTTTPYYNLRIKIGQSEDGLVQIGEYKFASDGSYPEERYIAINRTYLEPGENIILLENANPTWTGYWLVWDSLRFGEITNAYYQWYQIDGSVNDGDKTVPSIDNAWLAASLITIREYAEVNGAPDLAAQAGDILEDMDFTIWYNYTEHRFTWGALNDPQGGGRCDYYSNENRMTNFVARALGHLNTTEFQASLDSLVQNPGTYDGITVGKVNWDGSYFTYASPALFIREMDTSYGLNTLEKATQAQIRYAQDKNYSVWGISDALSPNDPDVYLDLGAPPAPGGYTDKGVITPYASAMALINTNQSLVDAAVSNLALLKSSYGGIYDDDYGFKDSVNLTDSAVSSKILTLDQEWIFLSLANYQNSTVWRYFYRDQGVRNAHCEMYNCSELTVSDIAFSPPNPAEGNWVTVNVTVQNTGSVDANGGLLRFYVDGASQNESTISVSAGSNDISQFAWKAVFGTHNISAEVNPDDAIVESDETDNVASRLITVTTTTTTTTTTSTTTTTTTTTSTTTTTTTLSPVDTTPPGDVNTTVVQRLDYYFNITWTIPSDPDLKEFNIYQRQNDNSSTDTLIDTVPANYMQPYIAGPGTDNGNFYQYMVTAVDESGNEGNGTYVPDTPVPPIPFAPLGTLLTLGGALATYGYYRRKME